jgi:tetratricopeptide (TPR) repeat protein
MTTRSGSGETDGGESTVPVAGSDAQVGETLVLRAEIVERESTGGGAAGLEAAEEAAGLVGFTPDPRLARAASAAAQGDDVTAISLYRELIHEDPRALPPRLALARLYQRREEHALAGEQLEAARALDPDDPDVLLGLAASLAGQRNYEHAEKELRRAQRLAPERWDVHQQIGIFCFKRGLYAEADTALRRAIELEPGQAASYFYRGEALNHLARVDEALEMLERAVQLDPGNGRAYYAMGILYDRKHLRSEAAAMYRKARETGAA